MREEETTAERKRNGCQWLLLLLLVLAAGGGVVQVHGQLDNLGEHILLHAFIFSWHYLHICH
jgi:hypothetical protein